MDKYILLKRCCLNENIRQIYKKTNRADELYTICYTDPETSWSKLDALFPPVRPSPPPSAYKKVARQLFPPNKKDTRKSKHPKNSILQMSQVQRFKSQRSTVDVRKLSRSYLNQGRKIVSWELKKEMLIAKAAESGMFQQAPQKFTKMCKYTRNSQFRHHPYKKLSLAEPVNRHGNTEEISNNK